MYNNLAELWPNRFLPIWRGFCKIKCMAAVVAWQSASTAARLLIHVFQSFFPPKIVSHSPCPFGTKCTGVHTTSIKGSCHWFHNDRLSAAILGSCFTFQWRAGVTLIKLVVLGQLRVSNASDSEYIRLVLVIFSWIFKTTSTQQPHDDATPIYDNVRTESPRCWTALKKALPHLGRDEVDRTIAWSTGVSAASPSILPSPTNVWIHPSYTRIYIRG